MKKITIKSLFKIFPNALKILREKIIETIDQIGDAKFRLITSYWHSLRVAEAKPICEAVAEIIWEKEIKPLQRRLKRLIYQHELLTSPKNKKRQKFISAESVKENIDLRPLIESTGVKVRRAGKYWVAICPFHPEKHPSFYIYDNHFHCYGCGIHGDVIKFIELKEGLSFKEALNFLIKYHD